MVAAALILLLVVVGCSTPPKASSEPQALVVGAEGLRVEVGSMTVSAGPGVAPEGTAVSVSVAAAVPDDAVAEVVEQIGAGVQVVLGEDLQPEAPIEVRAKVEGDMPAAGEVALLTVSADGSVDVLEAQVDTANGELVASTEHLSWLGFFRLGEEFTGVVMALAGQALDVTYPDPGCETRVEVPGVAAYEVFPPGQAYMCLAMNAAGEIELEVHSAVNMPYTVRTQPPVDATNLPGSAQGLLGTAVMYRFPNDGFTPGVLAGGSTVQFTFPPGQAPEVVTMQLRPELLVMDLLVATLDRVHKGLAEIVGTTQCWADVATTSLSANEVASTTAATSAISAALGCAANAVEGAASIVLGLVLPLLQTLISTILTNVEAFMQRDVISTRIDVTDLAPTPPAPGGALPEGVLGSMVATVSGGGPVIYCQSAMSTVYADDGSEEQTEVFSCVVPEQSADEYPSCGGPATFSYFQGAGEAYCGDDFNRSGAVPLGNGTVTLGSYECTPGPGYAVVHCGRGDFAVQVSTTSLEQLGG